MDRSPTVVSTVAALEDQLRSDGFKGTQRAMRLLKVLKDSLKNDGYSFEPLPSVSESPLTKKRGRPRKVNQSVDDALDCLASTPSEVPSLDGTDVDSPAF